MLSSTKYFLSFRFSDQSYVSMSCDFHACYIPHQSHEVALSSIYSKALTKILRIGWSCPDQLGNGSLTSSVCCFSLYGMNVTCSGGNIILRIRIYQNCGTECVL